MTGTVLHLDIETGSRTDLKKAGLYKYAECETTFMNVACYAFDDQPVVVWVPRKSLPEALIRSFRKRRPHNPLIVSETVPLELRMHIALHKNVRAHNAMFERRVLAGPAGQAFDFPEILASQMVCTMAKAASHGLPSKLENLADALGTHPKKAAGVNDMRYTSKPRKDGTFVTPEEEPERFVRLYDYCIDDVEAERAADHVIPDMAPSLQARYVRDQAINDRGFACDLESANNAQALVEQYKAELVEQCRAWTRCEAFPDGVRPSQTGKLAEWVRDAGYPQLVDLKKDSVLKACKDPECPPDAQRVMKLFSTHNMKAVAKFPAMQKATCRDGRLHGMFMFHAADTGRWSSSIVQLHNLFRPVIEDPELAVEVFRSRDLADVRFYYDGVDPMKVFASSVRSMLTAGPGKVLVFPDFAGIEARVNAWLWGEEWKLQAFRDYDTFTGRKDKDGKPERKGPDLYKVAYAKSFNIDPSQVGEGIHKKGRQVGKVQELALGYQGGVGAFVTMAEQANIDLNDMAASAFATLPAEVKAEAVDMWEWACKKKATHGLAVRTFVTLESFKRLWRAAHPKIVKGWEQLNEAAANAIREPGKSFSCARGLVSFKVWRQWLCLRLPSGRVLWYFRPQLDKDGKTVRFWGTDTYTRRWCLTSTYGGKLDENVVQAISNDLLDYAMENLEAADYPVVGHVHDEPVCETDEDFGSFEEARRIMTKLPDWARGLPIAVDGHRQYRYKK